MTVRSVCFQNTTSVLRSPLRTWPPRSAMCLYVPHHGEAYIDEPRSQTLTPRYSLPVLSDRGMPSSGFHG